MLETKPAYIKLGIKFDELFRRVQNDSYEYIMNHKEQGSSTFTQHINTAELALRHTGEGIYYKHTVR